MPSVVSPRRGFIRAVGTSAVAALSGCALGGGSDADLTVTPAPVPTETTSPTPTPTPPPPSPADVEFDVALVQSFTTSGPARLRITFENTGDRQLTGVGGLQYVLPFVDDDYAGVTESGQLGLFLAPDDAVLTVQPEGTSGGRIGQFLPDAPRDGCWKLPFDWPADRGVSPAILYTVSVPPGEGVSHEYGVYYIDVCLADRFTFESTFELTNSDPPLESALYPARLGFDLVVTPAETINIDVHDPVVRG